MRTSIGMTLAGLAALGLAACAGNTGEPEAAAAATEETAVEPAEWQPPEMPTAEEAAKAAADAQAAAEAGVVYAGADKNGQTVEMKVGQTLRIELVSVPTAGYVWNMDEAPAFMEPAGESTRGTDPAHQSLPGFTGGNHYLGFDYVAKAAGSGTFKLSEGRPWESDEPPTDTYTLTVTVTE